MHIAGDPGSLVHRSLVNPDFLFNAQLSCGRRKPLRHEGPPCNDQPDESGYDDESGGVDAKIGCGQAARVLRN
jgi:hypothetical protein